MDTIDMIYIDDLGPLEIVEIGDYYDKPLNMILRNQESGALYFAHLWAEERAADYWLYVPTSEGRCADILSGECSLRRAILYPESLVIHLITEEPARYLCRDIDPRTMIYPFLLPEEDVYWGTTHS